MGADLGAHPARTCSRMLSPAHLGTVLTWARTHSCRSPRSGNIPGGSSGLRPETRSLRRARGPVILDRSFLRYFDVVQRGLCVVGEAFGVDAQQYCDAVVGPFGDLGGSKADA
jgi:hypothetical protein